MRLTFFFICVLLTLNDPALADEWLEDKGDHFVIRYPSSISSAWSAEVLRAAEDYYDTIARSIDYSRYKNFWTWDHRVEITVYPDQASFLEGTKQPAWSKGGAIHRPWSNDHNRIVTYYQEENFLGGLLPHEISHLILFDFIGRDHSIPIWFNEGVAQLHEEGKAEKADQLMRRLLPRDMVIPMATLAALDIRNETDPLRVGIFYAQSVSIINFLIKQYGSHKFGILCRALRDGKDFEEALRFSYAMNLDTLEQLENKWLSYMKNADFIVR